MCAQMTGGQFVAETLKGYGITHVFFVEAILRTALLEMERLGIKRILTHGEKAAAYMADGYGKYAKGPGICMAQSVGAANLAAGLQDAYLGHSPVIALTGRKHSLAQHRHAYQEILHTPMFDPVTKYNVVVETVEQLPFLLRQAFREATSGTPGPAHLDLMGHQGQIIGSSEADLSVIIEESYKALPSNRTEPDPNLVREAVEIIEKAQRPVIVAGGGTMASSAGPEVLQIA
jgi:acetolactate synthase-1/2/3 large subunit